MSGRSHAPVPGRGLGRGNAVNCKPSPGVVAAACVAGGDAWEYLSQRPLDEQPLLDCVLRQSVAEQPKVKALFRQFSQRLT